MKRRGWVPLVGAAIFLAQVGMADPQLKEDAKNVFSDAKVFVKDVFKKTKKKTKKVLDKVSNKLGDDKQTGESTKETKKSGTTEAAPTGKD